MSHFGLDQFLEFLMLLGQFVQMSLQRHVLHLSVKGRKIRTPKPVPVTASLRFCFPGVND
jgi:hypothetical protein